MEGGRTAARKLIWRGRLNLAIDWRLQSTGQTKLQRNIFIMGRLGLAFKILFSGATAKKVLESLSESETSPKLPAPEPVAPKPVPPKPVRSDAITLLSALQRDARFVDFIQEPIDAYTDAQVGAAVREIHRGCHGVLSRMFAPTPIVNQEEGSVVQVDDVASGKFRLTGNVAQSSGSASGQLEHHGWMASKCEVPKWSGSSDALNIITPAEVQVS